VRPELIGLLIGLFAGLVYYLIGRKMDLNTDIPKGIEDPRVLELEMQEWRKRLFKRYIIRLLVAILALVVVFFVSDDSIMVIATTLGLIISLYILPLLKIGKGRRSSV